MSNTKDAVVIPGVDMDLQSTANPDMEIQNPPIEMMTPPIVTVEPAVKTPSVPWTMPKPDTRKHWPKGEKLPTHHIKRQIMPCPKCRRIRTDDGNQATTCAHSGETVVFYKCRCCKHRWQMPVKE